MFMAIRPTVDNRAPLMWVNALLCRPCCEPANPLFETGNWPVTRRRRHLANDIESRKFLPTTQFDRHRPPIVTFSHRPTRKLYVRDNVVNDRKRAGRASLVSSVIFKTQAGRPSCFPSLPQFHFSNKIDSLRHMKLTLVLFDSPKTPRYCRTSSPSI